ncbi:MAG: hypothetical protein QW546_00995 [Candidatus Bathyarchaeia archaeon]
MSASKFLPRRLSFSKICDILVAYLNAGADKEYVGVSEVASKSDVTLHNISRNNAFFKSWGFIEESEKEPGKYKLTREAADFAFAYKIDPNEASTRQRLRNILSKDEALMRFIERIKNESMDRNSVLIELPRVVGDLRADKVGLNAFLDLIAYAFQIDWLYTPIKPARKPTLTPEAKLPKPSVRKFEKKIMPKIAATFEPRANISINLTISPNITPEMLKEYIKALLRAYDEYAQERIEPE